MLRHVSGIWFGWFLSFFFRYFLYHSCRASSLNKIRSGELWAASISSNWEYTLSPWLNLQKESGPQFLDRNSLFSCLIAKQVGTDLTVPPRKKRTKSKRWLLYLKNWATYGNFRRPRSDKISKSQNLHISISQWIFEIWAWFFTCDHKSYRFQNNF